MKKRGDKEKSAKREQKKGHRKKKTSLNDKVSILGLLGVKIASSVELYTN